LLAARNALAAIGAAGIQQGYYALGKLNIGAAPCPVWVKRAGLTIRRSLPVFTYE
jgi:hypothetical protein